jgi:hypothetical protein
MKREIRVFKSFEEQELYFLSHLVNLTPSERLKALSRLRGKNFIEFYKLSPKKITLQKKSGTGY